MKCFVRTGSREWWGGASVLDKIAGKGISDKITLSKDLNKVKEWTMQISGGRALRQKAQQMQGSWGGIMLGCLGDTKEAHVVRNSLSQRSNDRRWEKMEVIL